MPKRATPLAWNQDGDAAAPVRGRGSGSGRGSRKKLSQESIVDAAIRLADVRGLDAVTIRRLASDLDVKPMSLYVHIATKDDLLALMMDEVVGEMLVDKPLPENWREALAEIARKSHAAYSAHPWVLQAFARGSRLGPNALQHAKQHARAVTSLGLSSAEVWTVVAILDDFVIGNAVRMFTRGAPPNLERLLAPGDLAISPELAEWQGKDLVQASRERFEIGLEAWLDSMELRFVTPKSQPASRQRRRPSRTGAPSDGTG